MRKSTYKSELETEVSLPLNIPTQVIPPTTGPAPAPVVKHSGAPNVLEAMLEHERVFTPTPAMRRAKGSFWTALQDYPTVDVSSLDPRDIAKFGRVTVTNWNTWCKTDGFKEWFLNRTLFRERIEYLAELALEAAESILVNEDPKAQGARFNVIKLVAELAAKFPKQQGPGGPGAKFLDQSVQEMSKEELEQFLATNGVRLVLHKEPETLNVTPTKES